MTVIDTSGVVDYLLGADAGRDVERLLNEEGELAAPDVMPYEVLAVIRRKTLAGDLRPARAQTALQQLNELPIELFPSLLLCRRAFELRDNFTAADALFAALAELLREPLATKDGGLARAVTKHCDASVLALGAA